MAHGRRPDRSRAPLPYWSQALRALREARGITQDGWAAQLGYGRATVRRWESGETVPSADAEAAIVALCGEKRLFRPFTEGPLSGVDVNPEWIADLLAGARLRTEALPALPRSAALQTPPVRYALSGDVAIAYQVFGEGPINLVVTPGAVSHRELDWEHPGSVAFFSHLGSFARVAIYDKRGTGMSDRVATGTLEERMDDIRAVMDSAGMERAALFGISEGGPLSILCAATYPERISSLILYGAYERAIRRPSAAEMRLQLDHLQRVWGTPDPAFLETYAPSVADDPTARAWWARYLRMSASPGAFVALVRMNAGIDVEPVLPTIRVPTLVLHRTRDRVIGIEEGRHLAATIPGARLLELEGDDHIPVHGDIESVTGAVGAFLAGVQPEHVTDRVLATVLHAEIDDENQLERVRSLIRRELPRWRGNEIASTGRELLATFDGPTRAVRCACAIRDGVRSLGMAPRLGVHTGEVEMRAGRISGTAVHVSVQLASIAAPGEILVSGTVTDLVADGGLAFASRGTLALDGVAGEWRVFSVEPAPVRP
jgi:pimeloyl-ACP methyl ester carboxylesterase/class 3 adenylate cyclase/transcriptional regulator with XRE-family HTH domain